MEPLSIIANQFPHVVIPLVASANDSIKIIIFDWRWYPTVLGSQVSKFNQSILEAVKRGVDVKCLVNNEQVRDRLLAGGAAAKILHSKKLLHTKMLLIDDVKLVIGSHNYTESGFCANEEASVFVQMPTSDNGFLQYFNALWSV